MKSILGLIVCAFSLLAFASTAQSTGEANGDFDFDLPDATGTIVFAAGINNAGVVTGQMSFSATVHVPDPDPDNAGNTVPLDVTLGVDFDCMTVKGNRAAMSGVITSANVAGYEGQEAMLVVADQVEGISPATDAFVWGVYQPTEVNLNAKDFDFCPRNYTPPDDCGVERGASSMPDPTSWLRRECS